MQQSAPAVARATIVFAPAQPSREQLELLLVMPLGLARQLLDAIERHLLGIDERALRPHRAHQPFLHEVELAHRLARQHRAGIEAGLALERGRAASCSAVSSRTRPMNQDVIWSRDL